MSRAFLLRATAPWALAAGAALVGLLWTAPVAGGHPVAGAQSGPALPALAAGPSPVERADEGIASLPPSRTSPRRSKRAAETRPGPPDATDRGSADDPTVLARVTEVLVMTVIILLFIAVLFGVPTGVAAVAVAMDDGGLRLGLSLVGWGLALVGGFLAGNLGMLLVGIILDTENLGPEALWLILGGINVFLVGHGAARVWIRRWLRALPEEKAVAWRRTLTDGALVGAGVGSIATLLRSAVTLKGSGFGGFGGGNFGGGGASGSWSGASGAATSGATAAPADTKAAGGAGVRAAGGAAQGTEAAASGLWERVTQWTGRLHWYHAVVFGLVMVVFFGVASTAMELFPFWGVVAPFALVLGYGLWRGLCSAVSSLQGDRYRSEAAARPRAEGPLSSSHDSWADRR